MKTITDNAHTKADSKDKFCYANDPLGFEGFLVVESHHDLVASLTGYYTVVAGWIEETDPAKAEELMKRADEVFQSRRADIFKSYAEREIIVEALSKEYKELAAFADEWKSAHKNIS